MSRARDTELGREVPIKTDPEFVAATPQPLFQPVSDFWAARNSDSPTRDGQYFLVNVDPETEVFPTAVVLNWKALLEGDWGQAAFS